MFRKETNVLLSFQGMSGFTVRGKLPKQGVICSPACDGKNILKTGLKSFCNFRNNESETTNPECLTSVPVIDKILNAPG